MSNNTLEIRVAKKIRVSKAIDQLVKFSEARPTNDFIAVICSDKADEVYNKYFPTKRR